MTAGALARSGVEGAWDISRSMKDRRTRRGEKRGSEILGAGVNKNGALQHQASSLMASPDGLRLFLRNRLHGDVLDTIFSFGFHLWLAKPVGTMYDVNCLRND